MECTQQNIDAAIAVYNEVTKAHKRSPVEKYVLKQLAAGETVEIVSGHPRWSSALRFFGTPENMHVEFVVNDALPESFKKMLVPMKERFDEALRSLPS